MSRIIGIDLGTTNSVACSIEQDEPRVIINEEGARLTPSVVGFSQDGERSVGEIAKRQLVMQPTRTVHSIKRFIGRSMEESKEDAERVGFKVLPSGEELAIDIDGKLFSPQELSALILQKVKKSAEDFLGETITEAVITVPAYFNNKQRQATRDAGEIAGLDVLRIINEPTAAALAYTMRRREPATIAVYDFGGGTFDISILDVDRDIAEVRATAGNNHLGGTDLDSRVVDWLIGEFRKSHGLDVRGDPMVQQRLLEAAEKAKIDLSTGMETEIHLPFLTADEDGPKHLETVLTRATFEFLVEDILDQTMKECQNALDEAGLSPSDIDEIVLVGGSSRVPKVQQLLEELFGRPLNKSFNPDEVVSIGAAVQAGMLAGSVKDVTLLDVTNFSLGLETEGMYFSRLIPKGSTVPVVRTQMVSTVMDGQNAVRIHVLQGEEELARENISLGEFELSGIQRAPRGMARIEVTFTIDTDGIVNVSARDVTTGAQKSITVHSPASMSRQQIEDARAELEAFDSAEASSRNLDGLREEVEKTLFNLEALVRDKELFLTKKEVAAAEQALKRGRMGLVNRTDQASLQELAIYLQDYRTELKEQVARGGGDDTSSAAAETST